MEYQLPLRRGGGVAVRNFEIDHRSSEHPLSAASLRNSKMAYS